VYYNIQGKRWKRSREILRRNDAYQYVQYNSQILWFACIYDAPLDIVQCIYNLALDQALYQNIENINPLHGDDDDDDDVHMAYKGTTPLLWTC